MARLRLSSISLWMMYPKQAAPNMASTTIRTHMPPLVAGQTRCSCSCVQDLYLEGPCPLPLPTFTKICIGQEEGRSPLSSSLYFLSPIPPLPKYRLKPRHLLLRYPYAHELGGMCRLLFGGVIVATILLFP
jgi:hypothetical protein